MGTAKFNLNLSEAVYADAKTLSERFDISMADVIRMSFEWFAWMTGEMEAGNRMQLVRGSETLELVIPELARRIRRDRS